MYARHAYTWAPITRTPGRPSHVHLGAHHAYTWAHNTYNMEHIGRLPKPNEPIHPNTIPLFGILSTSNTESGQCYFCFENIEKEELLAITMACCKKNTHPECFSTWTTHYKYRRTIRCRHCRAPFPYDELCYLCLRTKQHGHSLRPTECCETTVHTICADTLQETLNTLTFEFSLQCGNIITCKRLWHKK